jgi:hypothetical protein
LRNKQNSKDQHTGVWDHGQTNLLNYKN